MPLAVIKTDYDMACKRILKMWIWIELTEKRAIAVSYLGESNLSSA